MKAVFLEQPQQVSVRSVPEPQIQTEEDVKIRVHYSTICGDDIQRWKGVYLLPEKIPMGREMVRQIVECGRRASSMGFAVGDIVSGLPFSGCGSCYYCAKGLENLCQKLHRPPGAMAEYVVWRAAQLCRLPEQVSEISGCMIETLSSCMHAVDLANLRQGDSALIIGGGGAGLMLLQLVKLSGAVNVTVVEPVASKRQLALRLGADYVIDPEAENVIERVSKITHTRGFHAVFEASGKTDTLQYVLMLLERGGTLLLFSIYGANYKFPLDATQLFSKELTIRSSNMSRNMLSRAAAMLPRMELDALASKVMDGKTEAQAAFELQNTGLYPRIVLKFNKS